VKIETLFAFPPLDPLQERKGHHRSGYEKKQWEYQVIKSESRPGHMSDLLREKPGRRDVPDGQQASADCVPADDPEHVEPAKGVKRRDPAGQRLSYGIFHSRHSICRGLWVLFKHNKLIDIKAGI
jgi:hypothetical protein